MIQALKSWPFFLSKYKHECWEIETCMITYVFILARFRSVYVEIYDFSVNVIAFFERSNKRPDILKSSASHKLGGRIFEESIVDLT